MAAARASDGRLPFGALVIFTAILVLSPQVWLPFLKPLRIALLSVAVAFATHVIERTIRRRPVTPLYPEMAVALALVSWAVVTVPLSYWPGGSVNELTERFLKAVAFFWLIGTLVNTLERLHVFAWAFVLSSIPLAMTALRNFEEEVFVTSRANAVQRIKGYVGGSGIAGNPNDLALMLNLLLPITIALFFATRRTSLRLLAGSVLVLNIAAIIVTFSRAGFVTLVVIFIMSLIMLVKRRAPGAAIGVFVLALCVPVLLPQGYFERLTTITDISSDPTGSAQGRWKDFSAAADLVVQNPLVGVGIGQNVLALNQVRGSTWREVHNVYLQYAVDLGVPGLLLFLTLFGMSFNGARKIEGLTKRSAGLQELRLLAQGVQVSLVGFAVAAFFHPSAYQFYFFSMAGMAVALKHAYENETAIAAQPEARPKPQ